MSQLPASQQGESGRSRQPKQAQAGQTIRFEADPKAFPSFNSRSDGGNKESRKSYVPSKLQNTVNSKAGDFGVMNFRDTSSSSSTAKPTRKHTNENTEKNARMTSEKVAQQIFQDSRKRAPQPKRPGIAPTSLGNVSTQPSNPSPLSGLGVLEASAQQAQARQQVQQQQHSQSVPLPVIQNNNPPAAAPPADMTPSVPPVPQQTTRIPPPAIPPQANIPGANAASPSTCMGSSTSVPVEEESSDYLQKVKSEQKRIDALLQNLQPRVIVRRLLSSLARYGGGPPSAPPPVDGILPQSDAGNGSGGKFIAWMSEIFQSNSFTVADSIQMAADVQPMPMKRPRGRPKGSKGTKARKDKGIKKGPMAKRRKELQAKATARVRSSSQTIDNVGIGSSAVQVDSAPSTYDRSTEDNDDSWMDEMENSVLDASRASINIPPAVPPASVAEEFASSTMSADPAKRRGRPKGSKNKPKDAGEGDSAAGGVDGLTDSPANKSKGKVVKGKAAKAAKGAAAGDGSGTTPSAIGSASVPAAEEAPMIETSTIQATPTQPRFSHHMQSQIPQPGIQATGQMAQNQMPSHMQASATQMQQGQMAQATPTIANVGIQEATTRKRKSMPVPVDQYTSANAQMSEQDSRAWSSTQTSQSKRPRVTGDSNSTSWGAADPSQQQVQQQQQQPNSMGSAFGSNAMQSAQMMPQNSPSGAGLGGIPGSIAQGHHSHPNVDAQHQQQQQRQQATMGYSQSQQMQGRTQQHMAAQGHPQSAMPTSQTHAQQAHPTAQASQPAAQQHSQQQQHVAGQHAQHHAQQPTPQQAQAQQLQTQQHHAQHAQHQQRQQMMGARINHVRASNPAANPSPKIPHTGLTSISGAATSSPYMASGSHQFSPAQPQTHQQASTQLPPPQSASTFAYGSRQDQAIFGQTAQQPDRSMYSYGMFNMLSTDSSNPGTRNMQFPQHPQAQQHVRQQQVQQQRQVQQQQVQQNQMHQQHAGWPNNTMQRRQIGGGLGYAFEGHGVDGTDMYHHMSGQRR